ncbi:MAG: HAD-IA family hydrolase [Acidobacteria bacterium]|jgi:phosphoglycolate phosphatase|nr:HAD-IA family hydrolase [Acidobacteriota bacterium]
MTKDMARHREEGTDASRRKALTLIFDFDGTIADTLAAIVRLADKYNEDLGIPPLDRTEIEAMRGMSSREILRRHRIPLAKLPYLLLHYQKELGREIDKLGLFPGIREVLLELKALGVRLGILTSNSTENVEKFLQARELEVFDFIHSEKNLFGKTRALRHVMKEEDVGREEVMYVGDEARDIEACRKARVPVIAVSWGFQHREFLADHDPTYIVDSPDEILEIVTA